jgi:hypothetical protein
MGSGLVSSTEATFALLALVIPKIDIVTYVGEYVGEVGEYFGDVAVYGVPDAGEVGEYLGDVGE